LLVRDATTATTATSDVTVMWSILQIDTISKGNIKDLGTY